MEDKLKWDTKKCSRDPPKKARKGNKRKKTKVTADNNKTVGFKKKKTRVGCLERTAPKHVYYQG